MGPTPVVVSLPMTVSNGIPVNTQPTAVLIYDYYESGQSLSWSISVSLLLFLSESVCLSVYLTLFFFFFYTLCLSLCFSLCTKYQF